MARKKKFLITFLSMFFAISLGLSLENTCKAVSLSDYQLTEEIMEDICSELQLTAVSGDWITNYTNSFNTMMRTVRARGDYHQVTLADCIFLGKDTNKLFVYFHAWRDNNQTDGQDATLECNYIYMPVGTVAVNSQFSLTCYQWNGWTYDGNNNISGANTSACYYWTITNSGYTWSNVLSNLSSNKLTECDHNQFSISRVLILDNYFMNSNPVMIPCYTGANRYNYDFLFYVNRIILEDYSSTTPTGTPTSVPTGGGGSGGSTDLTQTNGLISDINDSLTDVPSSGDFSIPSSGEIVGAFSDFQISDPSDNFWSFFVTGIQAALTNDVRYLEFDFLGEIYILDNQAYSLDSIPLLQELVSTACIVGFIIVEFSFIHQLVVYISTLDLDIILKRLRGMDISDIFR